MSTEHRNEARQRKRPFQFSLRSLLDLLTVSAIALGLAGWVGGDLAAIVLLATGFALTVAGISVHRDELAACGEILMFAGYAILLVRACEQITVR